MGINASKPLVTVGVSLTLGLLYLYFQDMKKVEPRATKRVPIIGLNNLGTTCYLNAVLQALSSCRLFIQWLAHKDDLNKADFPPQIPKSYTGWQYPIIAVFYRSILVINRQIEKDENKYMSKIPRDIIKVLRQQGYRYRRNEEQDSLEFFHFILSAISKEVESSIRRQQRGTLDCLLDEEDTSDVSGELISGSELESLSIDMVGTAATVPVMGDADPATEIDWQILSLPATSKSVVSKRSCNFDGSLRAAPRTPFQGLTLSRLQCLQCMKNNPLRLETFHSLSLSIPVSQGAGDSIFESISVINLLKNYFKPSIVTQVDCENCSMQSDSPIKSVFSRKTYFVRLPSTLCLHISRVVWTGLMSKRIDYVSFPERLNLSNFSRHYHEDIKHVDKNQLSSFHKTEYVLSAVISHVGDYDSGHFTTFRRGPPLPGASLNRQWFLVSDEYVEPTTIDYVFSTRAYLLFYEKLHS